LLYKPLADCILHAHSVGIDTSITTNGVLFTDAFARRVFLAERLRWIKVSINAGTPDTYAAIHRTRPQDFDRVLRNLEAAVKVRAEIGSRCTIGAQMIALPETSGASKLRPLVRETYPSNIPTAEPLARRLRDVGIDYLVIKPYSQHLKSERTRIYESTSYADADAWASGLEALSSPGFDVVVRYHTMATKDASDRGYDRCHATPYHWAYVEADGEVWGCSTYLGRVKDGVTYGDDRFRFGNPSWRCGAGSGARRTGITFERSWTSRSAGRTAGCTT
jgi:MoaA/NifB/PqqE/SkfB family radical SAM enzyme